MELDGVPVGQSDLKALALYNYGHFTSMLVERMSVRGLSMHMDRLVSDSLTLFGEPIDPHRVRRLVAHAIDNDSDPVIARVTVFSPDFDMSHPGRTSEPRILVTLRPAAEPSQPALRVKSIRYSRDLPSVKHIGLFGQLYGRRTAQLHDFDDALFVDGQSTIAEGATWNIGFVRVDHVVWPRSDHLVGVTMRLVSDALAKEGIESVTTDLALTDLGSMTAAFATNAASGVRPISAIDHRDYPPDHPLLSRMQESYLSIDAEPL